MKKLLATVALLAIAAVIVTTTQAQDDPAKADAGAAAGGSLKTLKDKISYIIGVNIGNNVKSRLQLDDVDPKIVGAGLADALAGNQPKLTQDETKTALDEYKKVLQAKVAELEKAQAAKGAVNQKKADDFLAANKGKDGVKTTDSGLQYKIIKSGSGKTPTKESTVVTHYEGKLLDGTVFDSSKKRGEPATFPVGGVIAGWTEALQLMKEGDVWELYIPPTSLIEIEVAHRRSGRTNV